MTCAKRPDLDPDDRELVAPLRARGVTATPAVWDDPGLDWSAFDLAVLRSTWDYPARRDEFVAWAGTVPRLANPAGVVAWNTDKRYLAELGAAGVPVAPTTWMAPDERWRPPARGEWVIKPAVGAGSKDTGRYRLDDPVQQRLAVAHLARLQRAHRLAMVQPYLPAVDEYGETALVFLADPTGALAYSHAIRKGPMLAGPDRAASAELYRPEQITGRVPSAAELAVAERTFAAVRSGVPGGSALLYARVDLIPGPDGAPLLLELELTEPSLFLRYAPGAADRLAGAVAQRAADRRDPGGHDTTA